mmetsp:Transcript_13863/g.29604  ORF Transcript_13863/g.29604 Transcript_13863/m.29604 type:complete len:221 (+) Transcript_13863:1183-1845(+)
MPLLGRTEAGGNYFFSTRLLREPIIPLQDSSRRPRRVSRLQDERHPDSRLERPNGLACVYACGSSPFGLLGLLSVNVPSSPVDVLTLQGAQDVLEPSITAHACTSSCRGSGDNTVWRWTRPAAASADGNVRLAKRRRVTMTSVVRAVAESQKYKVARGKRRKGGSAIDGAAWAARCRDAGGRGIDQSSIVCVLVCGEELLASGMEEPGGNSSRDDHRNDV